MTAAIACSRRLALASGGSHGGPDMAKAEHVLKSSDATEVPVEIAGVGGRSYAFLIDWHIRVLLALALLLAAGGLASLLGEVEALLELFDNPGALVWYLFVLPPSLVYLLYHPVLEVAMQGRTPGKRMAGVRVVDTAGNTPRVGPLIIRNVFRLVDSLPAFYILGLLVAMCTARQVRIGDLAAGTVLVYERRMSSDAFSAITAVGPGALDVRQAELVDELLDRWRSLDVAVRHRLARRLLAEAGQDLPAAARGRALDRALHDALRALREGAP